jgi:hypothetical protein
MIGSHTPQSQEWTRNILCSETIILVLFVSYKINIKWIEKNQLGLNSE